VRLSVLSESTRLEDQEYAIRVNDGSGWNYWSWDDLPKFRGHLLQSDTSDDPFASVGDRYVERPDMTIIVGNAYLIIGIYVGHRDDAGILGHTFLYKHLAFGIRGELDGEYAKSLCIEIIDQILGE